MRAQSEYRHVCHCQGDEHVVRVDHRRAVVILTGHDDKEVRAELAALHLLDSQREDEEAFPAGIERGNCFVYAHYWVRGYTASTDRRRAWRIRGRVYQPAPPSASSNS